VWEAGEGEAGVLNDYQRIFRRAGGAGINVAQLQCHGVQHRAQIFGGVIGGRSDARGIDKPPVWVIRRHAPDERDRDSAGHRNDREETVFHFAPPWRFNRRLKSDIVTHKKQLPPFGLPYNTPLPGSLAHFDDFLNEKAEHPEKTRLF
jgi:hypothetical protein